MIAAQVQLLTHSRQDYWKDIPGYPGYAVDPEGYVWTNRKFKNRWVKLKPNAGKKGHLRVTLYNDFGSVRKLVHRLVLEAFVGPCPEGMEACHFPDANPANNNLANLRWDTLGNNRRDAIYHGTFVDNRGSRHGMSRLTESAVQQILSLFNQGVSQKELAARFGVHKVTIHQVCRGKRWRHVSP